MRTKLASAIVLVLGMFILAIFAVNAQAQVMSGEAVVNAEATIFQDQAMENSGGDAMVCIGNLDSTGSTRRGYVRYDLPDIPAGATVTRVVMEAAQPRVRSQGGPKAATLQVHRVTQAWEEGGGSATQSGPCAGGQAVPGLNWNNAPSNRNAASASGAWNDQRNDTTTMDTDEGSANDGLINDVQAWVDGEDNNGWRLSVAAENVTDNARGVRVPTVTIYWEEQAQEPIFVINQGINDAWFNPATDGQGLLIIVYESIPLLFLAWFTYEADVGDGALSSLDRVDDPFRELNATLGDDDHRWITAAGGFEGDTAMLDITVTSGGKFDAGDPVEREVVGTIELKFEDCTKGVVKYNIPSINRSGEVPIQRVANDNVPICEARLEGQ